MGSRVDNGNLSVYFLQEESKDDAILFAKYWKEQGYVGERKQIIQIEEEKDVVFLKLIERKSYQEEEINITEEALLQDIERDLEKNVFHKEVEIVITDNTFRPLQKRNL